VPSNAPRACLSWSFSWLWAMHLMAWFFAGVSLAGCASQPRHQFISGEHGLIDIAPLPSGAYTEGNSAAWLQFLLKASFNGYSQKVTLPRLVAPPAEVRAGLAQLQRTPMGVLWIGHSTFLIRIGGITILTDPVFSAAAAPLQAGGPQRYAPPALEIAELPHIDVILVSHNHYDHLDDGSLARLGQRFPDAKLLLPAGNELHGLLAGLTKTLPVIAGQVVNVAGVRITALPAYHETSRYGLDAHQTEALGYSLRASGGGSIYFAGDTAYGPMFKKFRAAFGDHDAALVPIGAYEPRKEVRFIHASPEEGLRIATDVGAKIAVGMHWGTFPLSQEPVLEPARRFMRAARQGSARPVALRIGGYLNLAPYRQGD